MDIHLRNLLHYWGPISFYMSLIFSEGVPKWSGNLSNRSRTIWPTYPTQYLRRSLPCCRVFECLTGRLVALVSGDSCLSLSSLWWKGLQNSQRDYFAPSRGVFSLPSYSLVSWQKRSRHAFDRPKVSQFSWGFSKVLRRTSPQLQVTSQEVCTFVLFSLYCDGEGANVMFPFSLTEFLV